MSHQVDKAFVQQFRDNVQLLVQQRGSKLAGTTMEEPIVGEKAFFEQIGAVELSELTTRHADTAYSDTPHDRRMCVFKDFARADLIDKQDRLRMLLEPTNAYAINFARAAGRRRDQTIIDAALATAYAGKDGTTAVSFDANNQVAADFGSGSGDKNLTVEKITQVAAIFDENEVPEEDRIAVITGRALRGLRSDDQFTSHDYNDMKPLATGMGPGHFMGFTFYRLELLPKSGNTHTCLFWQKEGIKLGIGKEMEIRITPEMPNKNYATQVYISGSWGAVRLQEKLVASVLCDSTK